MRLLFSPTSPYVRKCLVAAHELGLDHRIQLVPSQAHPVRRDREILPFNPLGKVPTLLTEDGEVIHDSRVICEYLNDLAQGSLLPAGGAARWRTLTALAVADGILDAALLARYEDSARPEALRWPDWRAGQLDKVETSLRHLEGHPAPIREVNLAGIALGCALRYLDLRFAELRWRDHFAGLADWYGSFAERPSMRARWEA